MNKLSLTALALAAFGLSTQVNAETQTLNVSIKVTNTFNFAAGKPLSFGELLAFADINTKTNQASYVVNPNPLVVDEAPQNVGDAKIQVFQDGEPGSFNISGTAPFSSLIITPAKTEITIGASSAGSSAPKFTLSDLKFYIEGGANDKKEYNDATAPLISDKDGKVNFYVGGTLKTQQNATESAYQSGDYTGNIDITVTYK